MDTRIKIVITIIILIMGCLMFKALDRALYIEFPQTEKRGI